MTNTAAKSSSINISGLNGEIPIAENRDGICYGVVELRKALFSLHMSRNVCLVRAV
jgi:hypothetical protein